MSIPAVGSSPDRRHDLDALRAAAMLLGIALHAAIPYAPFFPWSIRDSQTSDAFTLLFISIHGFRMPLFFLISGFFTAMVWKQKGMAPLLRQRTPHSAPLSAGVRHHSAIDVVDHAPGCACSSHDQQCSTHRRRNRRRNHQSSPDHNLDGSHPAVGYSKTAGADCGKPGNGERTGS